MSTSTTATTDTTSIAATTDTSDADVLAKAGADAKAATEAASSKEIKTPEELAAEVDKWKAMSRKHESESKANAAKAKQFDDFQESQKTELQKVADRAAAAEATLAEVTARAMRAEVAAAKGVPANLLTGSTKEELEAAADALVAFRGMPRLPDTGGGARGSDVNASAAQLTQADVDKLTAERRYDEIEAAREAGRLSNLLGAKP